MDLPNTLMLLRRNPELVAWRTHGTVINVAPGGVIWKVFVQKPYRWHPSFEDIIATDWDHGTSDQAFKHFEKQRQAEAQE